MFAKLYNKNSKSQVNIQHQSRELYRLNKFISDCGVASRREADEMIQFGRVKVNGVTATLGMKITDNDVVTLDNQVITLLQKKVYLALNKPKGIVSTTDTSINGNMVTFMNLPYKIFPIGRLDKDTEGLILLTNDGDIVNKILRAENGHEKEYIVTVDKPITKEFKYNMENGVNIYNPVRHTNQKTLPAKVTVVSDYVFKLCIKQGLNRQIRRMADALGYHVIDLKRIRIMHIQLKDLPTGYYRHLTDDELMKLNEKIK